MDFESDGKNVKYAYNAPVMLNVSDYGNRPLIYWTEFRSLRHYAEHVSLG